MSLRLEYAHILTRLLCPRAGWRQGYSKITDGARTSFFHTLAVQWGASFPTVMLQLKLHLETRRPVTVVALRLAVAALALSLLSGSVACWLSTRNRSKLWFVPVAAHRVLDTMQVQAWVTMASDWLLCRHVEQHVLAEVNM